MDINQLEKVYCLFIGREVQANDFNSSSSSALISEFESSPFSVSSYKAS